MKRLKHGATAACLTLLSACAAGPKLPEVQLIEIGCPSVTRCQLPPTQPLTNGDLRRDLEAIEAAWHDCAAQVDMINDCQRSMHKPVATEGTEATEKN